MHGLKWFLLQNKDLISKKQIPKKDILRMQDMLQNKTQVETVNFRPYFKVIIRKHILHSQDVFFWNLLFTLLF